MKKKFSPGKIWSNYSFIFVMIIIMIVYAIIIEGNGNAFKWSHIAAILGSLGSLSVILQNLAIDIPSTIT